MHTKHKMWCKQKSSSLLVVDAPVSPKIEKPPLRHRPEYWEYEVQCTVVNDEQKDTSDDISGWLLLLPSQNDIKAKELYLFESQKSRDGFIRCMSAGKKPSKSKLAKESLVFVIKNIYHVYPWYGSSLGFSDKDAYFKLKCTQNDKDVMVTFKLSDYTENQSEYFIRAIRETLYMTDVCNKKHMYPESVNNKYQSRYCYQFKPVYGYNNVANRISRAGDKNTNEINVQIKLIGQKMKFELKLLRCDVKKFAQMRGDGIFRGIIQNMLRKYFSRMKLALTDDIRPLHSRNDKGGRWQEFEYSVKIRPETMKMVTEPTLGGFGINNINDDEKEENKDDQDNKNDNGENDVKEKEHKKNQNDSETKHEETKMNENVNDCKNNQNESKYFQPCKDGRKCKIYKAVKDKGEYSLSNYKHISKFNHFKMNYNKKPLCTFRKCEAFERALGGKLTFTGQDLPDLCHLKIYRHVHSGAGIKGADMKSLKLTSEPQKDEAEIKMKYLLREVVENGFEKDLCLDKKVDLEGKVYTLLGSLNEKLESKEHKIKYLNVLHPSRMLALILYTGCDCTYDLCKTQRNGNYKKWVEFDVNLFYAIKELSKIEDYSRYFEKKGKIYLYSGLKRVQMDLGTHAFKCGYFPTYVSTSYEKKVAYHFSRVHGMLLQFDPQIIKEKQIKCCSLEWISKFKNEREILFARTMSHNKDRTVAVKLDVLDREFFGIDKNSNEVKQLQIVYVSTIKIKKNERK